MGGLVFSLGLIAALPCAASTSSVALPPAVQAQVDVAAARSALRRGEAAEAAACLDRALAADADSALALRARAQLRLRAGALEGAAEDAARAAALGDVDPELAELRAVIAARRREAAAARGYAERADTWAGSLIGASLDDPRAAYRASALVGEPTYRGALAALVLAGHEARVGDLSEARGLAAQAARDARSAAELELSRRAAGAARALTEAGGLDWWAQVGSSVDYLTNPAYASSTEPGRVASVRLTALGRVGARFSLGPLTFDTALDVRQHGLLARRGRFCCLDLFAYRLGGAVSMPLGADPRAVRLGLVVRWTDVFADRFRFHHAAHLEGGPTLAFRLGPRLTLDLAFLGVLTDFVDTSPPDASASSLNRDRVGQRAVLGLRFGFRWVDLRVEAMFLNDDADGDAFDALGGAAAAWLEARPQRDLTLFVGGSVTAREMGPVGDRAVIGAAATRTQLRTALRFGARLRLVANLELVLEDIYIDNAARAGHDYTANVLSVGVQSRW